jgi:glycosyltransferase involved in cell wall biosynthesis
MTRRSPKPWLTIVMPVHDGARTLTDTLASLAVQDMSGIRITIWDSSSDDACLQVVRGYQGLLPIDYRPCPDVKPWQEKMNLGVAAARSPYVAILHQDDLWLEGRVAALRKAARDAPDAALHIWPAMIVDAHGQAMGKWSLPIPPGHHGAGALTHRLLVQNFIAIPAPLIRTDAWLSVGGMDPALWYTADWDLYLKLAKAGPVRVHGAANTAFRIHGASLTMTGSRNAEAMREQLDIVLARHGAQAGGSTLRRARASATINCSLAAAAAGERRAIGRALSALLLLGPANLARYLHESRLLDRLLPRVRARFSGVL